MLPVTFTFRALSKRSQTGDFWPAIARDPMVTKRMRKQLLEKNPHLKEFMAFLDVFNRETERGAALTALAMLDDLLGKMLRAFLIDNEGTKALMDGPFAPLGTMAAKTAAAYAMGLISAEERREIDTLRKIRNEFAHEVHVSFKSESITKLCSKLTYAAKAYGDVVVNSRSQFTTSASFMILGMTNRPRHIGEKRLSYLEVKY